MTVKEQSNFDTDLISIVAHDLKTPISAVKGFIELLQHSGPLTERQMHFSERALHGLKRMELLIVNLLDFARLEANAPLDMSACDMGAIITDVIEMMESSGGQRGISIEADIAADLQPIVGDARLLSQLVNNLLSNAMKYNVDDGKIWVNARNEQAFIRVDIRDSGIGIPADEIPHVFERFFRVKSESSHRVEGSGLGLAIVYAIVQRHDGHIWVESKPGEGSTFSFTLPHTARRDPDSESSIRDIYNFSTAPPDEGSSEQLDAVDDNMQESREESQTDSHSDMK